jgi:hypothetical protein
LDARGWTHLHDGWTARADALKQHATAEGVNRALLLTDGLANIGVTDATAGRRFFFEHQEHAAWPHLPSEAQSAAPSSTITERPGSRDTSPCRTTQTDSQR